MGHIHRLIAFDLDGTLIDSRRDLAESANELIVEFGGAPLPEDAIGRMVGEGAAVLVRRALDAAGLRRRGATGGVRAKAGLEDLPGVLARFLAIYDSRLLNHTRVYDGMADVLRVARHHGRVVVLTNKPKRPSERILEGLGLRALFDDVVGGDGPHPRKPDPAALLALMQDAGASADRTLLVGDSWIDHETARRGGVRCCLVSFESGFQPFPKDRLTGAEWIVSDARALHAAIERFAGEV